jgi:D-beta-D-heptose 7-phosphate kinase/D-beta-D-heptose 1-phosphate adenosyltransferase
VEIRKKRFFELKQLNEELLKVKDKRIVFTNGVFDLIHAGHIDILEFAKSRGDYLIVGLNDDNSVRRLKGNMRPIYPLAERMEILESIMYVDFIIPFSEDTPLSLIKGLVKIDILVKGKDYQLNEVAGREVVEKAGGKVLLFDFKSNLSTSGIIDKVKKRNPPLH